MKWQVVSKRVEDAPPSVAIKAVRKRLKGKELSAFLSCMRVRERLIEEGKGGKGWLGAPVAHSDEGIMLGVVLEHASEKVA